MSFSCASRAAYGEALALYKIDDRRGQADVLTGLGDLERKLGRNDQARAAYGEALALYKQVDNRLGQGNVLRGLGRGDRAMPPPNLAAHNKRHQKP